jgi:hypothetical protein
MRVELDPTVEITVRATSASAVVHIPGVNVGRSPAMQVHAGAIMLLTPGVSDPPLGKIQREQCGSPIDPIGNDVVFPEGSYQITAVLPIFTQNAASNGITPTVLANGKAVPAVSLPTVIGCLDYVIDFSRKHKQTAFLYEVPESFDLSKPGTYKLALHKVNGFGNYAN